MRNFAGRPDLDDILRHGLAADLDSDEALLVLATALKLDIADRDELRTAIEVVFEEHGGDVDLSHRIDVDAALDRLRATGHLTVRDSQLLPCACRVTNALLRAIDAALADLVGRIDAAIGIQEKAFEAVLKLAMHQWKESLLSEQEIRTEAWKDMRTLMSSTDPVDLRAVCRALVLEADVADVDLIWTATDDEPMLVRGPRIWLACLVKELLGNAVAATRTVPHDDVGSVYLKLVVSDAAAELTVADDGPASRVTSWMPSPRVDPSAGPIDPGGATAWTDVAARRSCTTSSSHSRPGPTADRSCAPGSRWPLRPTRTEPVPQTRVHVLVNPVTIVRGEVRHTLKPDHALMVTALLLAGPDGLPAGDLGDMLDVEVTTSALRKRRQRLTKQTGLAIPTETHRGETFYRLDFADLTADTLDYLELAAGLTQQVDGPPDRSVLDRASALWTAEPPELGAKIPDVVQVALDRLHTAHAALSSMGKRILIVDDHVAGELAKLLRLRHFCDVARSFDEFDVYKSALSEYDLAVVDLHLSPGYGDEQGDIIVQFINRTSLDLPVVMMSVKPPDNQDYVRWTEQLGLVAFIKKDGDGPSVNLRVVADRVNELLEEDPAERACVRIAQQLVKLRRKARKRLERQFAGQHFALERECKTMNEHGNRVNSSAERADLAATRRHLAAFKRQWGE